MDAFGVIEAMRRKRIKQADDELKFAYPLGLNPCQDRFEAWNVSARDLAARLHKFLHWVLHWPMTLMFDCRLCKNQLGGTSTCCFHDYLSQHCSRDPVDDATLLYVLAKCDPWGVVVKFYWQGLVRYMERVGWAPFLDQIPLEKKVREPGFLLEAHQAWHQRLMAPKWQPSVVKGAVQRVLPAASLLQRVPPCFSAVSQQKEFKWRMQALRMLRAAGFPLSSCYYYCLAAYDPSEWSFDAFTRELRMAQTVFEEPLKAMSCNALSRCSLCPLDGDGFKCQARLLGSHPQVKGSPQFTQVGIDPLVYIELTN